jgi:NitT/TauT family transport system permease protein
MKSATGDRFAWLWPLVTVAGLIGLWSLMTFTGAVADYLLPSPGKVVSAVTRALTDGSLLTHLIPTLQASLGGLICGALLATGFAALVTEFRWAERALLVHLLALQAVPKVSLAPLVFLWAGFDIGGKVILVTLICFFPVFANAMAGFRSSSSAQLDLMRASGASRWHAWCHVKLPAALPGLFSGLEVSVAFALIGCVVMEFIGATRGLGFLIQDASSTYDLPLSFAAVIVLGALGSAGNVLLRTARQYLLPWERAGRRGSSASGASA